ncbi:ABC transporter permease [uncultured Corynebacterium sp.]|uniref:ABC transporter permease n=1 Tax=uncultured Corynebacterium sp. TaxID=159447 RepID=UPI0025DE6D30|nr:FtsX-like permease family protein [uncultured Corynebacterium sp.]
MNKSLWRLSARSVLANKVRFLLTILSVVLGTGFIAGSFMFTDALQRSFDGIVSTSYSDVDVAVQPKPGEPMKVSEKLGDKLRGETGVEKVNVADQVNALLADKDDQVIKTGGAPSVVGAYYSNEDVVGPAISMVEGSAPRGDKQVVLNQTAAEKNGVKAGDKMTVFTPDGRRMPMTVSGIYTIDMEVGGYAGAFMDEDAFLNKFSNGQLKEGYFVKGKPGTNPAELKSTLAKKYPNANIEEGQIIAEEQSKQISEALKFVNYFLVAFGLVALLVGTFIIANTFSMIVAQRMREFALLRSLGMSQGQLTISVILEAILVGIVGSLLGVLAGVGIVKAIYAIMDAFGFGLPTSGLTLTPQAIVIPLVLGLLVTVASAWAPARRAGRVHPVEAMRSGDQSSSSSLKARTLIGTLIFLLGTAAAVYSSFIWTEADTKPRAILVGVGALFIIVGTFLISPALSRIIVPGLGRAIGAPFGSVGKLAATNSQRNPRRTAATAFALTLGVALVASFGMLGASMKASISGVLESSISADYVVAGDTQGAFTVTNPALQDIKKTEGVGQAMAVRATPLSPLKTQKHVAGVFTVDGDVTKGVKATVKSGSLDLSNNGAIVDAKVAEANGWKVGDKIKLGLSSHSGGDPHSQSSQLPDQLTGKPLTTVTVNGIYEPNQVLGELVLSQDLVDDLSKDGSPLAAFTKNTPIMMVLVNAAGGMDSETLKSNLEESLDKYIIFQVLSPQELAGQSAQMVDGMLNTLYALLALAIVVAVLGIINTLALNVIERRQEIGMLRAVGTFRGQVRRMISLEAIQIAIYGALVGVLVGLGLGWCFIRVLQGTGLNEIAVPWGQVAAMMVGSAVVGAVAALWPARKAARTAPLEAITD